MDKSIPQIVEQFLAGDDSAFAELVKRFRKKIYSVAFRILGNHLDADEVVQETFVKIYNKRKDLQNVKYFTSFILRIAYNHSIDLLRKRKGHSNLADDSTSLPGHIQLALAARVATPSENLENKRLMNEILRALDELPTKQRLTAILHDIEGFTKAEIAITFGCPEATVRSNLHIARNKLKKILKKRLHKKE